jgi:hypothetical protein
MVAENVQDRAIERADQAVDKFERSALRKIEKEPSSALLFAAPRRLSVNGTQAGLRRYLSKQRSMRWQFADAKSFIVQKNGNLQLKPGGSVRNAGVDWNLANSSSDNDEDRQATADEIRVAGETASPVSVTEAGIAGEADNNVPGAVADALGQRHDISPRGGASDEGTSERK